MRMRVPYNRGGLRTYLAIIGLLACQMTPFSIESATPLILIGIFLHLWAKGCLHQNTEVTTTGPYSFVRHPFYLANIFLDFGIALMSGWRLLLLFLPFWWLAVYIPVMRQEEAKLTLLFGDTYREYCAKIPRLFPYRRPLSNVKHGFSWNNPNVAITELPRTFRFLSYPLLFLIAYRLRIDGIAMFYSPTSLNIIMFAAIVSLYLLRKAVRLHFRHRKQVLPSIFLMDNIRSTIFLAVILVGFAVGWGEIENDLLIIIAEFLLLGMLIFVRKYQKQNYVLVQGLIAVGLAIFFELMWLAVLLIPLYVTVLLDQQLMNRQSQVSTYRFPIVRLRHSYMFSLMAITGMVLSIVKELYPW